MKEEVQDNVPFKPILCLDFDGVCHSYTSGWHGPTTIPDPPVEGLFEFLEMAIEDFEVVIYSTRSETEEGREAMRLWLLLHYEEWCQMMDKDAEEWRETTKFIGFPSTKPPAFVSLDDRVITFIGKWPTISSLKAFKPWNKK